ncbi:MAG: hypothetical protein RIC55_14075 [Pirellulaceae bacterium]
MEIADHKRKLAKRLRNAKQAIERSPEIPRELKAFLLAFLGHTSAACDYKALWPSQTTLGRELGYAVNTRNDTCSTIGRHVALLRKIGAVEVRPMGNAKAESYFFMRYEYRLKTSRSKRRDQHRLNYYFINYGHPIWQGKIDATMLADHKKRNRGEIKRNTTSEPRDQLGRFVSKSQSGWMDTKETLGGATEAKGRRTTARVQWSNHRTGAVKVLEERATEPGASLALSSPGPPPTLPAFGSSCSPCSDTEQSRRVDHSPDHSGAVAQPQQPCLSDLTRQGLEGVCNERFPGNVLDDGEYEFLEAKGEEILDGLAEGESRGAASRPPLNGITDPEQEDGDLKESEDAPPWLRCQRSALHDLVLATGSPNLSPALLDEEGSPRHGKASSWHSKVSGRPDSRFDL